MDELRFGTFLSQLWLARKMSRGERENAVSAMNPTQKAAARQHLRLMRRFLTISGVIAACQPMVCLGVLLYVKVILPIQARAEMTALGVIGGADGPTAIIVATAPSLLPWWVLPLILAAVAVLCFALAHRLGKLERKLI